MEYPSDSVGQKIKDSLTFIKYISRSVLLSILPT